ncbi:MAG TPA: PAS domain S-box protein, partial [Acidobacteriota bacterium]|nr:PAS domain S-box protein [Acidobacteriota bacterium]
LNKDPRWPKSKGEIIRTKAVVISPIKVEKKPIGVLVGNMQHHAREMDSEDVVRFEMFANMVGLALESVRAYQNLERTVIERTRELRDANRQMREKTQSLEKATYSLAQANVQLLAVQEQLEKKNSEVEAILDSALSGILMINRDGIVTAANRRLESFFGVPVSEYLNRPIQSYCEKIHDRFTVPSVFEHHSKELQLSPEVSLTRDTVEIYEKSFELRSGLILGSMPAPVVNSEGEVIGRVWIYIDITRLKRVDDQLHRIIEAAPVPLIVSRIDDGKVLFVNENMAHLMGVPLEEATSKVTQDYYFDLNDRRRIFDTLASQGYVSNYELRLRKGDGSLIWAMLSVQKAEIGGVPVIIGGINDFTKRKIAEEALQESEERFRSLVENANDIIYSLNPARAFSYVSPQWKWILGHDVSEVVGQTFQSFVHPDDLEKCLDYFEKIMDTGAHQSGMEYRVRHKNGEWRWHVTNASVMRGINGEVISFIGICHDVTANKKVLTDLADAYRNLRQTQSQLVQSEKMAALGMLVAGIAHEINTPISAIQSMHDTLSRGIEKLNAFLRAQHPDVLEDTKMKTVQDVIQDANRVIASASERVSNIVKRLRSFARLDEAELKTVNIHEGLDDTLSLIQHELRHSIKVNKEYGKIPMIAVHPGRLNQVFLNMLINARQAIKNTGEITIRTFLKNGKVHISISDNGIGIPAENIERLFDPGFTTKGVGVGTGLGLSICYQIIQDHKGEIKVESEAGKGSTFTIILPTDLQAR